MNYELYSFLYVYYEVGSAKNKDASQKVTIIE